MSGAVIPVFYLLDLTLPPSPHFLLSTYTSSCLGRPSTTPSLRPLRLQATHPALPYFLSIFSPCSNPIPGFWDWRQHERRKEGRKVVLVQADIATYLGQLADAL